MKKDWRMLLLSKLVRSGVGTWGAFHLLELAGQKKLVLTSHNRKTKVGPRQLHSRAHVNDMATNVCNNMLTKNLRGNGRHPSTRRIRAHSTQDREN